MVTQARQRHVRRLQIPLQIAVVGLAIAWLVHGGRFNIDLLRQTLGWRILTIWGLTYLVIQATQTIRWWSFANVMGLPLHFRSAVRQMGLGMFWGAFTPALMGVDVSRLVTLTRAFPGQAGPAALTIVADRLMLVVASLLLSALALPFAWPLATSHPVLLMFAGTTAVAGVLLLIGMIGLIYAPVERWPILKRLVAGRLAKTYTALAHFRGRLGVLFAGLALGLVGQGLAVVLLGMLVGTAPGRTMSWADLLLIVPLGWHAMSLPVAPAGFGVGQVAFEHLFAWAGCEPGVGATVVTTYQLCLISIHVLAGLFWFLPEPQGTRS